MALSAVRDDGDYDDYRKCRRGRLLRITSSKRRSRKNPRQRKTIDPGGCKFFTVSKLAVTRVVYPKRYGVESKTLAQGPRHFGNSLALSEFHFRLSCPSVLAWAWSTLILAITLRLLLLSSLTIGNSLILGSPSHPTLFRSSRRKGLSFFMN